VATAIVVDSRSSLALEFTLRYMLRVMPKSWVFVLVHTRGMRDWVRDTFGAVLLAGKLHAWELGVGADSGLRRACWDFSTGEHSVIATATSRPGVVWPNNSWALQGVQTVPEFYAAIPTEKYLIFQTDSALCENSVQRVYDFFPTDYIGAVWPWGVDQKGGGKISVGNGGLSLRTKSVMLRILDKFGTGTVIEKAEDLFLSSHVSAVGGRLATVEEAGKFCVETMINDDTPVGFHKPWAFVGAENLRHLSKHCPVVLEYARLANYSLSHIQQKG